MEYETNAKHGLGARILATILSCCIAVSFAACSTDSDTETSPSRTQVSVEAEKDPTDTEYRMTAMETAQMYVEDTDISRDGLIWLLEDEGYSTDDAKAAVESLSVDWDQHAVATAQYYLDGIQEWTRDELIEQLIWEMFSVEQAHYAVDQVGL